MPSNEETEYVCAFSGEQAEEEDLATDAAEDDPLGDMPAGWTQVLVRRRLDNPEWVNIQAVKESIVAGHLAAIVDAKVRKASEESIRLQVDAQFAALEANTDRYVTVEGTAYISPPESSKQVAAAVVDFYQTLGIMQDEDEEPEGDAPEADGDDTATEQENP